MVRTVVTFPVTPLLFNSFAALSAIPLGTLKCKTPQPEVVATTSVPPDGLTSEIVVL